MDLLDRAALISLAGHRGWPALSLYVPTHTLPTQAAEDRLRLKNLLREACERLVAEGLRPTESDAFCAAARDLLEDDSAWRGPGEGLAIFVSSEATRAYRTDFAVPERSTVGDRFYLRPMHHALRDPERFYALALDKNGTRLFAGDRWEIKELDLGEAPTTLAEAMKYEEAGRSLTTHSTMPGRVSSRGRQHEGSSYAGFGGEKDVELDQALRFSRLIEKGVAAATAAENNRPLVLLGTERLLSAYREVNTYPQLADEQVTGASSRLTPLHVQDAALEALGPVFSAAIEADLYELTEAEGSGLVAHDPAEIAAAAVAGRVKTLFFDDIVGPFGTLDRETLEVSDVSADAPAHLREASTAAARSGEEAAGWDLVDLAAAETVLHGGMLRAFEGEDAPLTGIAAVYRY